MHMHVPTHTDTHTHKSHSVHCKVPWGPRYLPVFLSLFYPWCFTHSKFTRDTWEMREWIFTTQREWNNHWSCFRLEKLCFRGCYGADKLGFKLRCVLTPQLTYFRITSHPLTAKQSVCREGEVRELEIVFYKESLSKWGFHLRKGTPQANKPRRTSSPSWASVFLPWWDEGIGQIIGTWATDLRFNSCDTHYSLITAFFPTELGYSFINILDSTPCSLTH